MALVVRVEVVMPEVREATYDNRPQTFPPADDHHAFFNEPLRLHDADLCGWMRHFGMAAARDAEQGRHFPWRYEALGNGQAMIYVHQVAFNGRWCCAEPA